MSYAKKDAPKRRRELDEMEEQMIQAEQQRNAPKEQQYLEELKQAAEQSITPQDRERALIDLRVESEEAIRRRILGMEDDAEAGWDVDALKKQFESGGIRRQWDGGPLNFNFQLEDHGLHVEKLAVTAARRNWPASPDDEQQWQWKLTNNKGGVTLFHPSGELRCQGQWTQQLYLHCMLKRFTRPWTAWQPDKGKTPHDGDANAYKQFFENGVIKYKFPRGPDDLKACFDVYIPDGVFTELPSKGGASAHLYKSKKMKGAIRFAIPPGEVALQGNLRQQVAYLDVLKKILI